MADFDLGGLLFGNAPSSGLEGYLDPEQLRRMQQQGVMQAAMALLKASGPSTQRVGLGQALGEAYGAGQAGYQQAQQQGIAGLLTKQKMDEAAADRKLAESLSSGDMGASFGLTPEQARIVAMNPKAMLPKVLEMQLGRKDAGRFTPMTAEQLAAYGLPPGTSAVINDLTGKPEILSAAEKPQAEPDAIRTLRALGLPPTVENLRLLDKPEGSPTEVKLLAAAGLPPTLENIIKVRQSGVSPGTTINMPGNKELLGGVGKDISATLSDLTAGARTANQALQTIDRMLPALDKAIVGPAADYRTGMLRIGQQLGIAGADANAVLANTRTVVQGLAQQELDAASQMKGQGSLTEAERAILKRAASGDQTLSAAEIQQSLATAQKVARYRLQAQQDYLGRVSKLPDFQQFAPMYQVTPYQSQNQFPADIQNILNSQRRLPSGSRP
jgi:Tfp pilus assembly protein PilP